MNKRQLLGLRIRELRRRKGLSQEKTAEKAETSPNYLSRMERGTENPTLDMLIKIAEALNIDMWELFDYSHLEGSKSPKETLRKLSGELDDEQLKTVVKIIRAIAR